MVGVRVVTFAELASRFPGAERDGNDPEITGVAGPSEGGKTRAEIWFEGPVDTEAPAVVDGSVTVTRAPAVLRLPDLSEVLPELLDVFVGSPETWGISPDAHVANDFKHGDPVYVGPAVHVGPEVTVGDGVRLEPGVVILGEVTLGDGVVLHPNVSLQSPARLGDRCVVHANSVIGADGYGYRQEDGTHQKTPQIGRVVIGDDVEIGSCVTIDRATFGTTRIGSGTKIDNHVQIAHNATIGENCLLVSHSGLAGSASIGDGVVLAAQAGIRDHVHVADGVVVAGRGAVTKDIDEEGAIVSGFPARDHQEEIKHKAALRRVPQLRRRVRELERDLEELREASE